MADHGQKLIFGMHPDTFVLAGTLAANITVFTFTVFCFHRVRRVREDYKFYLKKCQNLHQQQDQDLEGTLKLVQMKSATLNAANLLSQQPSERKKDNKLTK